MGEIFVVGGHGYVGTRIAAAAQHHGRLTHAVTRYGGTKFGLPSTSWPDFLAELPSHDDARVIWLLDGAKDDEPERLGELLTAAGTELAVVAVSTCTVYGNRGDELCTEDLERRLLAPHAEIKAGVEDTLAAAEVTSCALRLGALYGVDDRAVRPDRIESWVREGREEGVITVPAIDHWRGWLHRDQAARALYRAAANRSSGVFNVTTANLTFGQAVEPAARVTGAEIRNGSKPDPLSYRVDSSAAIEAGLLDVLPGEGLEEATLAYARTTH
jgi:nucleoside-diphosphate-sugar epimerase